MASARVYTCIRVRPPLLAPDEPTIPLDIDATHTKLRIVKEIPMMSSAHSTKSESKYLFDRIFNAGSPSSEVFLHSWPMLRENLLQGYHGVFCVYGQTGSGKTYTVDAYLEELLPTVFGEMQDGLLSSAKVIAISYVQIYMDGIYDLLNENRSIAKSRASDTTAFPIPESMSAHKVHHLLLQARKHRKLSEHALNRRSSRSHTVFILHVELQTEEGQLLYPKLYIVDLAGSERLYRTLSAGNTFDEGCNINKSLSCLAKCLECMAQRQAMVPYRESALTYFLRDALSNSLFVLLCCVSPEVLDEDETRCTLHFATVARKVVIQRHSAADQARRRSLRLQYEEKLEQQISNLKAVHEHEVRVLQDRARTVQASTMDHRRSYEELHERYGKLWRQLEATESELEAAKYTVDELQSELSEKQIEVQEVTLELQSLRERGEHSHTAQRAPNDDQWFGLLRERMSHAIDSLRGELIHTNLPSEPPTSVVSDLSIDTSLTYVSTDSVYSFPPEYAKGGNVHQEIQSEELRLETTFEGDNMRWSLPLGGAEPFNVPTGTNSIESPPRAQLTDQYHTFISMSPITTQLRSCLEAHYKEIILTLEYEQESRRNLERMEDKWFSSISQTFREILAKRELSCISASFLATEESHEASQEIGLLKNIGHIPSLSLLEECKKVTDHHKSEICDLKQSLAYLNLGFQESQERQQLQSIMHASNFDFLLEGTQRLHSISVDEVKKDRDASRNNLLLEIAEVRDELDIAMNATVRFQDELSLSTEMNELVRLQFSEEEARNILISQQLNVAQTYFSVHSAELQWFLCSNHLLSTVEPSRRALIMITAFSTFTEIMRAHAAQLTSQYEIQLRETSSFRVAQTDMTSALNNFAALQESIVDLSGERWNLVSGTLEKQFEVGSFRRHEKETIHELLLTESGERVSAVFAAMLDIKEGAFSKLDKTIKHAATLERSIQKILEDHTSFRSIRENEVENLKERCKKT